MNLSNQVFSQSGIGELVMAMRIGGNMLATVGENFDRTYGEIVSCSEYSAWKIPLLQEWIIRGRGKYQNDRKESRKK
jgi:hypothetical protein